MKIEFNVAMNAEEKALKNLHKVVLNVEKCDEAIMLKYATKAYIVEIQGQIRNNWDAFMKGDYPRELVIGQALFAKKVSRPMTEEEKKEAYKKEVMSMKETERLDKMFMDGLLTEEMYDALIKVAVAKEEMEEADN